jgi:hypothetical protein
LLSTWNEEKLKLASIHNATACCFSPIAGKLPGRKKPYFKFLERV